MIAGIAPIVTLPVLAIIGDDAVQLLSSIPLRYIDCVSVVISKTNAACIHWFKVREVLPWQSSAKNPK